MSASSDRIDPQTLREMLRGARCAACEGRLDVHAHCALLVGCDGVAYFHLICATCFAGDHADVAERVELNLTPTQGRA